MSEKKCHVAIVGGGIAGLYTAYRLRQAWKSDDREKVAQQLGIAPDTKLLEIAILEQNPVGVGGRIRSVEIPYPDGSVTAELGAMRLTSRHKLVRSLLHALQIRTIPFEGDGFTNHYYLRGKHFGAADIEQSAGSFPYHLEGEEKGKSPAALVSHVLERTLKDLSLDGHATPDVLLALEKLRGSHSRHSLTHREWRQLQEHGRLTGKSLRDTGMWNLIHHYLSPEAASFVESGFGYESIIGNWNVSDAIPWFIADFSPSQTYETVVGSFKEVLKKLQAWLENAESPVGSTCSVILNARVTAIKCTDDGFVLELRAAAPEYKEENPPSRYKAGTVVLALPKRPLKELQIPDVTDVEKNTWLDDLEKVRSHRLVKIVHAYRHAWWRAADAARGCGSRTYTDLPLRQLYYVDREWLEARGRYRGDATSREVEGMVVAYLDGHYASFWRFISAVQRIKHIDSFADLPEKEHKKREAFGERIYAWIEPDGVKEPYSGNEIQKRAEHLYFTRYGLYERASVKMNHILEYVHANDRRPDGSRLVVPNPVAGVYAFWDDFADDPFSEAGWHTWESGVDSGDVINRMIQPFGPRRMFVCGEAYSTEQGWIEGALKSAELVLAHLGVSLPKGTSDFDDMREYLNLGTAAAIRRAPPERTPFSAATRVPLGNGRTLVFLSGKIGFDPEAPPQSTSIESQTKETLRRVLDGLKKEGGKASDLRVIRAFLRSMDDYAAFNDVYTAELKDVDQLPARTTIAVKTLPADALVEMDAIAIVKSH